MSAGHEVKIAEFGTTLLLLCTASFVLIVWCDIAFVIDAIKAGRRRILPESRPPGMGDWIVWITAILFSVYSFSQTPFFVRAYEQGFGRHDIVLTVLALTSVALVFDIGLICDAVRMRQVSLARKTNG